MTEPTPLNGGEHVRQTLTALATVLSQSMQAAGKAIADGIPQAAERNQPQLPFNLTAAEWGQVERDMAAEITDMNAQYERIWGRPRPHVR